MVAEIIVHLLEIVEVHVQEGTHHSPVLF
jgi:hypothetical protein